MEEWLDVGDRWDTCYGEDAAPCQDRGMYLHQYLSTI